MKKIVVAVDVSQFAYACYDVWNRGHRNAETFEETVLNMIYNALSDLYMECAELQLSISPILVMDSRPSFRVHIYPEYKAHRSPSNIDWDALYHYLTPKYPTLLFYGLEADDVLYMVAEQLKEQHLVVLLTSDADAAQTCDMTGAIQYCPKKKQPIPTDKLWRFKFIVGCVSDGVPSLAPVKHEIDKLGNPVTKKTRLGEKTVRGLLEKGLKVKDIMQKHGIDPDGEEAQRNIWLIMYNYNIYKAHVGEEKFNTYLSKILTIVE